MAQDDYKVSRNLTLNLGLRWEQNQPYHEKFGRWANFNPNITNTKLGVPGALEFATPDISFEGERDWTNFSPRLGFAYRAKDRVVIRAGYGIYYLPLGIQYWGGVPYSFAPGYRGTDVITSAGIGSVLNWDNGYPGNFREPTQNPNALLWGMVGIDENSLTPGRTHQYNVSLQYGFDESNMIEFTFLGNQGRKLHNGALRRNQPTRAAYENPNVNPFAWIWDEASAAAAGVPYPYAGFSGFAGMALTPFPQVAATWGPLFYVGSPLGESSYRSFQVAFNRRMITGMAASVSYNYSRAEGNSETNCDETWNAVQGIQDAFDLAKEANTVLSYDQTHVFKGFASFELPFGRGRKWLSTPPGFVDAILGGWTVTSIFSYASGRPLGVAPNAWRPGWSDIGNGTVYANVTPGATFDNLFKKGRFDPGNPTSDANRYFDPASFSNPEGQSFGNGFRLYDKLRGVGDVREDIGLMKYWSAGESVKLQFRAEMVNVFNRHRFANPITSLGSPFFGRVISTAGEPRSIQMGLRANW